MEEEKTYSWSTNEENYFGDYDSPEKCKKAAISEAGLIPGNLIFIGENEYFDPQINIGDLIERFQEDVFDFCGDAGESWLENLPRQQENLLQKMLDEAFQKWMEETNNRCSFFSVSNIQKIII